MTKDKITKNENEQKYFSSSGEARQHMQQEGPSGAMDDEPERKDGCRVVLLS